MRNNKGTILVINNIIIFYGLGDDDVNDDHDDDNDDDIIDIVLTDSNDIIDKAILNEPLTPRHHITSNNY